jgi:hypothetical protein
VRRERERERERKRKRKRERGHTPLGMKYPPKAVSAVTWRDTYGMGG